MRIAEVYRGLGYYTKETRDLLCQSSSERFFCPYRNVFKNEAAEVLKLFGYPDYRTTHQGLFGDVKSWHKFNLSIEALVNQELIPEWVLLFADNYGPNLVITRAQWFWLLDQLLYYDTVDIE